MPVKSCRRWWIVVGAIIALFLAVPWSGADAQQTQERRHLRHILLRSEADADMILDKLAKGEGFKKLCRTYSLDPTTKVIGGDLGEHGPGQWEESFTRAAFAIPKINGVAKAKSQYGWHVIQLLNIKKVEVKKPKPIPPRPQPRTKSRGIVNNDLTIEVRSGRTSHLPGEDVEFTMVVKNTTDKPLNVFNPKLWPLGLVVRYQFGRMRLSVDVPWGKGEPEGGLLRELGAGQTHEFKFRLQDYTGELQNWPIIRGIWHGKNLLAGIEKRYPQLARSQKDFGEWKRRWRYYASEEIRVNVLPQYKKGDRWFAACYIKNKVWVELKDPGVPGLLEQFIGQVRQGKHRKIPFEAHRAGEYLAAGAPPTLPANPRGGFPIPADHPIEPHKPLTMSLLVNKTDKGRMASNRVAFALTNPKALDSMAIPIGDVFKGREHLDWAAERLDLAKRDRRVAPSISVIHLYPYEILPPDIKQLAKQPLEERQRQDRAAPRPPARRPPTPAKPRFARDLPRVDVAIDGGVFTIELFEDHAPNTVANFIELTEKGFYDGLAFHRLVSAEMNRGFIQGGSPDGTRLGAPPYRIKDEKHAQLKHVRGTVAMASNYKEKDTGGSQFYICMDDQPQLDGEFTIFGRVIKGIEVVDKLAKGAVMTKVVVVSRRKHEYKAEKIENAPRR